MKLNKILAGPLLVLALVFPQVVLAEDFTFNVEVNLSNMHQDVAKLRIHCGASISNAGGMVGEKIVEIDIPANGAINNTFQLAFNAEPGRNRTEAKVYRCDASLINRNSPNSSVTVYGSNSSMCQNPNNDWRCGKPGSPFVMSFYGSFPESE